MIPTKFIPKKFEDRLAIGVLLFVGLLIVSMLGFGFCNLTSVHVGHEVSSSSSTSHATHESTGHHDPFAEVALDLAMILTFALFGAFIATKLGFPKVAGILIAGIFLRVPFPYMAESEFLALLAGFGALLILFEAGLESSFEGLKSVGGTALAVAMVGVIVPLTLGFAVSWIFFPDAGFVLWLFTGATLSATSVGVTVEVLREEGVNGRVSETIIGAAVADDVAGVILLGVCAALAGSVTGSGTVFLIVLITGSLVKAGFFIGVSIWVGKKVVPHVIKITGMTKHNASGLVVALIICFTYAGLASVSGLAVIIGAFFAGLFLSFAEIETHHSHQKDLEGKVHSIGEVFKPVFFIYAGLQVDILSMLSSEVILFGLTLSVVAILGKLACERVAEGSFHQRMIVAVGMIARGEVGLIFATSGASLAVFDSVQYSAILLMVLVTTLVPTLWLPFHARRV